MKFEINQIDANPFRHIDRYPIREDKITKLRASIQNTSFWDNIVARVVDGRAQIAYGHHRLEALRREFEPDHEVELIVRGLPDEQMLKIMANENMEEWGSSALVEHETIRAVVEAYAAGQIELEQPAASLPKAQIRYAPSFIAGDGAGPARHAPYTAQSVGEFLGWLDSRGRAQEKVLNALAALSFIEEGTLDEAVFATLSTQQAGAVVEQARSARRLADLAAANQRRIADAAAKREAAAVVQRERAERDRIAAVERADKARDDAARRRAQQQAEDASRAAAAARKAEREAQRQRDTATENAATFRSQGQAAARSTGGNVGNALRSGQLGYKNAWQAANPRTDSEPDPKLIDDHAAQVAVRINRLFDPEHHKLAAALDELIRFRTHMSPGVALTLARELTSLAARVEVYRTKLSSHADTAPNRDFDIDILDAEEVPDYVTKEIER